MNEPADPSDSEREGSNWFLDLIRLTERFWFFRGFVAAFAFLGFGASFLDMSQWEFARGIHAIIASWNDILATLASILSDLLPIPELSPSLFNIAILLFSSTATMHIGLRRASVKLPEVREDMKTSVSEQYVYLAGGIALLAVIEVAETAGPEHLPYWILYLLMTSLMGVLIALHTAMTMAILPKFRRGFIYALSFLIMVEALYWLPFTGDALEAYADDVLGEDRATE